MAKGSSRKHKMTLLQKVLMGKTLKRKDRLIDLGVPEKKKKK